MPPHFHNGTLTHSPEGMDAQLAPYGLHFEQTHIPLPPAQELGIQSTNDEDEERHCKGVVREV